MFGDGIYSDDSFICESGIHAGLLTDKGGEIQIIIEDGQNFYPGVFKNGIYSSKKENYIRSFRVVGDREMTCNYFKEEYNPSNIFINW